MSVILALAAIAVLCLGTDAPSGPQAEPRSALVAELARSRGLEASPSDVHFVTDVTRALLWPSSVRAWLRARTPGSSFYDIYLCSSRWTREGQLLQITDLHNLTKTQAANEGNLAADGALASWSLGSEEEWLTIKTARLRSPNEAPHEFKDFTFMQKWQSRLRWLQTTGQLDGVQLRSYRLDPPAQRASLQVDNGVVEAYFDDRRVRLSAAQQPVEGGRYLRENPVTVAQPGNLVTWLVDRIRQSQLVGDDAMQWVKAVAFKAKDVAERRLGMSTRSDDAHTLGAPLGSVPALSSARDVSSNRNWPPPALTSKLSPPMEGEGQWLSLLQDPFVRKPAKDYSPFLTTFIRVDEDRPFSRILIAAWDPAIVELRMMSGTEEPQTATGETGTGLVPRDERTLRRFVAGFNGGFQGSHGNFGMQVQGTLYVPPIPYAATVARLKGGAIGFGSWPESSHVPADVVSFRQNLTALVQGGKFNPYGRIWWGGVPSGWEDDTHTIRSGICLTKSGLVAYFYGTSVDHKHLAKAMQVLDCDYGLHLDMNRGHTGLEFYNVGEAAQVPQLGLKLHPMWQAEGEVPEAPGFRFRGRRLFKSMALMNFPRYIKRQARDFFYLLFRPSAGEFPIADTDLSLTQGEGRWVHDLFANNHYPQVAATTHCRPDPQRPESKVRFLHLDPNRMTVGTGTHDEEVLGLMLEGFGPDVLVQSPSGISVVARQDIGQGVPLSFGDRRSIKGPQAAWGVDDDGLLVYVEVATAPDPDRDAALLERSLRLVNARPLLYLPEALKLSARGKDLSGHPRSLGQAEQGARRSIIRRTRQLHQRIFEDEPVPPHSHWKPLQNRARKAIAR